MASNSIELAVSIETTTEEWCIYRVPSKLRNVHKESYTPQLLSIGPFHNGNPELKDMESHKKIYYKKFLERSLKNEDQLKGMVSQHLDKIRNCYAGTMTTINSTRAVNLETIILVDACFIIELFMTESEPQHFHILRSPWMRKAVQTDLILFENQIPYFFLQVLYDFASPRRGSIENSGELSHEAEVEAVPEPVLFDFSSLRHDSNESFVEPQLPATESELVTVDGPFLYELLSPRNDSSETSADPAPALEALEHPFHSLACDFFKEYTKDLSRVNKAQPKHFTDLVRQFVCTEKVKEPSISTYKMLDYDVRKLKAAGVSFTHLQEPFIVESTPIVDVAPVVKGTLTHQLEEPFEAVDRTPLSQTMELKLTRFWATYETESLMRNLIAFEQLMYPEKAYISSYFLLLSQLVNTVEDMDALIKDGVVVNLLGSNTAVEKLINSLCVNIREDMSCYWKIHVHLNNHYKKNPWNRRWAILKQVYFKDLWTGSATVLGLIVLALSATETIRSFVTPATPSNH